MTIKKITLIQFFLTSAIFAITFIFLKEYNYIYITTVEFYFDNSLEIFKSQMASDARLYYQLYLDYEFTDFSLLAAANKNLIPPILQLYIFDGDMELLYFFFLTSLSIAIYYNLKYIQSNKKIFLLLVLVSPVVISDLYGPSKEMASYISILFLLSYIISLKKLFLIFAIFFAFLTRFELVLVIVSFYLLRKIKYIKRKYIILSLLILLSIIITFVDSRGVNHIKDASSTSSLGLISLFEYLESRGLYIITFYFKAVLNLYEKLLAPDLSRLGGIFTTMSSVGFFILSFIILKKKNYKLDNDISFFIMIYLILFCASAYIQHRYFVSLYPLFLYLAFNVKKNFKQRIDY